MTVQIFVVDSSLLHTGKSVRNYLTDIQLELKNIHCYSSKIIVILIQLFAVLL